MIKGKGTSRCGLLSLAPEGCGSYLQNRAGYKEELCASAFPPLCPTGTYLKAEWLSGRWVELRQTFGVGGGQDYRITGRREEGRKQEAESKREAYRSQALLQWQPLGIATCYLKGTEHRAQKLMISAD